MKSIKIILLSGVFTLITLFCVNHSYSQSLQFCESVSNDGYPVSESSVFTISEKGGFLKFLVKLPYTIGTNKVTYEIYKIDSDGYENYDNTIYQDVEGSWTWFWKEVTFYQAGRYNIYVYDGDKNFLTSEIVRIQYQ